MIRRFKWHAIVFVVALAIVLVVPAPRLILSGWIAGEPTLDRLPLRYYLHRLEDSDESVRNEAIKNIYTSRDCAAEAAPAVAAYLKKMREAKELNSAKYIRDIALGLGNMKDPPLRETSPIIVELLLCRQTDHYPTKDLFDLYRDYREHDPELADALATTVWGKYTYEVDESAKILNNIDHIRLKKELLKMLQSLRYEWTACELIEKYCPDLEDAVPQLEEWSKRDADHPATKALSKIREYKKKQQ